MEDLVTEEEKKAYEKKLYPYWLLRNGEPYIVMLMAHQVRPWMTSWSDLPRISRKR